MAKKPLVIITRKLPEAVETRMRELFDARLNNEDTPMTAAQLAEAVAMADVLVPTITDRIDAALIAKAGPNLKLIAHFGAGVDNIDVKAATDKGITVTNTPGVLTEDTADMTMALILAVPRRLVEGVVALQQEKFKGWAPNWMLGHRLHGKRLGIVGLGRIGQAVARRASAFGLQIHYHNRRQVPPEIEQELEATYWDSLDQMLARMDIVSINCPHTPATFHLLSARRLKLMKPTAYIVNTARGEVIDENTLALMLEKGQLSGAGLDVFENEPAVNPKLLKARNVVLLPHMGSATIEGRIDTGEKVIVNIRSFVDGHKPPDRVIPAMLWLPPMRGVTPVSFTLYARDFDNFAASLGASFEWYGIAIVADRGLDQREMDAALAAVKIFFALPDETRRAHISGRGGQRDYVAFGQYTAKGATLHDLKEAWHVGRDLPAGHSIVAPMSPNVWPEEVLGFRHR